MIKILKSKKAEGYIDIAVAVLIITFVLILALSIWSMVTLKQDMNYMCSELLDTATVTGKVGMRFRHGTKNFALKRDSVRTWIFSQSILILVPEKFSSGTALPAPFPVK